LPVCRATPIAVLIIVGRATLRVKATRPIHNDYTLSYYKDQIIFVKCCKIINDEVFMHYNLSDLSNSNPEDTNTNCISIGLTLIFFS